MRITYQVQNAQNPVTVTHGGPGGNENLKFQISGNILSSVRAFVVQIFRLRQELHWITATQKLVAVYGSRNAQAGPYGSRKYVPKDIFTSLLE